MATLSACDDMGSVDIARSATALAPRKGMHFMPISLAMAENEARFVPDVYAEAEQPVQSVKSGWGVGDPRDRERRCAPWLFVDANQNQRT